MFTDIAIAIAIITGLTEVIKRLGLPTRFVPLTAVILGVIYGGFVLGWSVDPILTGIIAGLSAVGLYRSVQKTLE